MLSFRILSSNSTENLDHGQRKNSIKIRGLREGVDGGDLMVFFTELFTAWIEVCDVAVSIIAAYRIGLEKKSLRYPRDVVVSFLNGWINQRL